MKVSLITPTYNSSKTLLKTLESVARQTYKDIEHIIIDGKSSDTTIDIIKSFPHIHKYISEPDNGMYDAMNKGIKLSSGEIIGILNSDDYYTNDKVIENIVKQFEQRNMDALYADINYIDEKGKIIRKWRSGDYAKIKFLDGWMPPHPTFFIKKVFYEKYGLYQTSFGISADYELMLRMLFKYDLEAFYFNEVIIHMLTGGQSNSSLKKRIQANVEDRRAWEINNLNPHWYTLLKKPFKKVIQYVQ